MESLLGVGHASVPHDLGIADMTQPDRTDTCTSTHVLLISLISELAYMYVMPWVCVEWMESHDRLSYTSREQYRIGIRSSRF